MVDVALARTSAQTPGGAAPGDFTALHLRGVSRHYGTTAALTGLDLTLERGEFVALLGPSGCGKSTALACIAGLQPLTAGTIWRDDRRIDTLPPEKRGFGMVFQNYALFPHLSVRRNVEFGLVMRKVGKAERRRRADEALGLVQLSEHAGKVPGQLSGGQQQRVAIARALAIDPQIVLMDEPLSNLDATLRVEMRTEIKRLYQERALTVLYVTHDQEEALSLATRLVVLRAGRLEQTGTPQAVYTEPASAYVAAFMGYRNLFPARYHAGKVATGDVEFATGSVLDDGTDVTVAIRPEDIAVTTAGPGTLRVRAEVVEYHGRELSVRAVTEHGFRLHFTTTEPVAGGALVDVAVPAERVLAFPGGVDDLPH